MNVFEFVSVSVAFDGNPVLEDFSLAISQGDKVIFRGPSGSGKSTLLRLLLGFVRPDSGEVRFRGEVMTPEVAWRLRREIAYVHQAIDFETGTAGVALDALYRLKASPRESSLESGEAVLEKFDLSAEVLKQPVGELSGGEKQRIALAAAIRLNRSIFLLDEPTAALDGKLKQKVADFFLNDRPDWTVIAVAHDEAWFENRDVNTIELSS